MTIAKVMKNQKGITLIEVLVSLAVFSLIGTAVLGGLMTTSKVVNTTDARETAKNLAETQMEWAKSLPYATSYSPAPTGPEYSGFIATINTNTLEDNYIQRIVVSVNWGGQEITSLEGYKVK